jgi:hypothetical protein
VRGPNRWIVLTVAVSFSGLLLVPNHALGYVGPGPGLELIPSFYSLLTWVALALGVALLWPVQSLLCGLREWWRTGGAAEMPSPGASASSPGPSGERPAA